MGHCACEVSDVFGDVGGAVVFGGAFLVFVFVVVESFAGYNLDDGEGVVAIDSDGEFAAGDVLFDEDFGAEAGAVGEGGLQGAGIGFGEDVYADGGALVFGFDDECAAELAYYFFDEGYIVDCVAVEDEPFGG